MCKGVRGVPFPSTFGVRITDIGLLPGALLSLCGLCVVEAGAVCCLCPRALTHIASRNEIRAYWFTEGLLSALAVDNLTSLFRDGIGGTRGKGTFKAIDQKCRLPYFYFLPEKDLHYVAWSSNHGTPWGEGPPATYCPTKWDPDEKQYVPVSEEECNEIFEKARKRSEYNARCDMSFHSAQAESVPVQPTTSSDNASGGSRPDGTSATANSSSAQAGYAVAPGVAQVDRAISPPRDIP